MEVTLNFMSYQFVLESGNYEDLASGRVLYNMQGTTAFPVRLASEIFLRGKRLLQQRGNSGPYRVYDPCGGGGYLLTTIGFLHGEDIAALTASDVNPAAVELARKNLSLLTRDGLHERIKQLEGLYESYGKESHQAALDSARRLGGMLEDSGKAVPVHCFTSDITGEKAVEGPKHDFIISDIPYGQTVEWKTDREDPVEALLANLEGLLAEGGIAALVSPKDAKIQHDRYIRLSKFQLGKRKITYLFVK